MHELRHTVEHRRDMKDSDYSVSNLRLICGCVFLLVICAARPAADLPGFVEIPAGPFTMGADRARDPMAFDNERWSPAQGEGTVDVPAFFIGRREVTAGEYTQFAQAGKWPVDQRALAIADHHPVAFVSWTDALAYCRWLEAELKASPTTPAPIARALREGARVTLPTEAEWEKAARGADRRRYPWGDEPRRDRANFGTSSTVPAGSIACPECAHGLSDMAGNVWEWTRSPLQPYPYDAADDRSNLDADALWVMRGGGFADNPQLIRTTTRGAAEPGARRAFIGFRVAISKFQ
jgi:formylglycine-generating enzyme required for sulfatase activity